jgi:hypothetical protein
MKATSVFITLRNRSISLPGNRALCPQASPTPQAAPFLPTKLASASVVTPPPPPQKTNSIQAPRFQASPAKPATAPGAQHIAAARAKTERRGGGLTFNPAQLARVDSADFCGACHRTWQDVISGHMIEAGVFNVRFAPYRLENSMCWTQGDARITCVACHDPHKPLSHVVASYDANCLACHASSTTEKKSDNHPGPACPVATKNCVTCHMPKVEPPNLHSTFTDHWIRIAKPGSAYPE